LPYPLYLVIASLFISNYCALLNQLGGHMSFNELLPYLVSVVVAFISGLISFSTSTNKSKQDLKQLQEQNKHDLERLMNQHKMDLESLEIKQKMEIEKIELEHKNKIELMEKEVQNNLGSGLFSTLLTQTMNMPEVKEQIRQSIKNASKK
jgi:hypothetical protein